MSTSNIAVYVDRFFEKLELAADRDGGKRFKPYFEERVREFLHTETPNNASLVYRAFFELYRITLPGKDDPFVNLVESLRDYENTAATLIDKQRDHFVHAVNVFLTGLAIYGESERFRKAFRAAVPEKPYKKAYKTPGEEFFFRWGVASLFHDMGYPVEIVGNQINRYIRMVADADGDEVKVRAEIRYKNFDELDHIKEVVPLDRFARAYRKAYPGDFERPDAIDPLSPLDLLAARISHVHGTNLSATLDALNGAVDNMAKNGFIDHGYYSALILLKWYGYLIQASGGAPERFYWPVVDSATAVLLHNYYKNVLQKAPFGLGPMRAKDDPVAFLLILCDELQEWNRTARGILTRTFTLAESANVSLGEGQLGVTYITREGLLPDGFCAEKKAVFRKLLAVDEIFPAGVSVDNVSLASFRPWKERILSVDPEKQFSAANPLYENVERLAIAIHSLYNEKRLREHPEQKLAYPNFSDLPDDMKYSNFRQAKGIYERLASAGLGLREEGKPGAYKEIPEELVEMMAEKEHIAWVEERIASGWTSGPKDVAAKKTPYLVPYAELSEEIKDYDRAAIRNIPDLAAVIGLAVYDL
ncbi:MAG: hypothetical protein IKX91_00085 [Firmicutes bacterium]|nr:hypothetical protein [Bacillota bacterium]